MSSGTASHKHPPHHDVGRRPQLESRVERLCAYAPRPIAKPGVGKDRRAARAADTPDDAQRSRRNRRTGNPQQLGPLSSQGSASHITRAQSQVRFSHGTNARVRRARGPAVAAKAGWPRLHRSSRAAPPHPPKTSHVVQRGRRLLDLYVLPYDRPAVLCCWRRAQPRRCDLRRGRREGLSGRVGTGRGPDEGYGAVADCAFGKRRRGMHWRIESGVSLGGPLVTPCYRGLPDGEPTRKASDWCEALAQRDARGASWERKPQVAGDAARPVHRRQVLLL